MTDVQVSGDVMENVMVSASSSSISGLAVGQ